MGIEFLDCNECGKGFPDVYGFEYCECGRVWCDEDCAEKHGLLKPEILDEDGEFEDYDYDNFTCKFCRGEEFDDDVLLNFVLKREGISRKDLVSLYKKEHE